VGSITYVKVDEGGTYMMSDGTIVRMKMVSNFKANKKWCELKNKNITNIKVETKYF
jgi:hypothetical protein